MTKTRKTNRITLRQIDGEIATFVQSRDALRQHAHNIAMILSLMYKLPPEKCRFIMVDPKMLELSIYEGIPHLIAPVVTDPNRAAATLKKWALVEMENRYETMLDDKYDHGFAVEWMRKDLGICFERAGISMTISVCNRTRLHQVLWMSL